MALVSVSSLGGLVEENLACVGPAKSFPSAWSGRILCCLPSVGPGIAAKINTKYAAVDRVRR